MGLSEAVRAYELDLSGLKEVVRRYLEVRLRNSTGREELSVGVLEAYDWKRNSPFMHITLKGSELGYIFPLQRVVFLFHNTATTLVDPLSMAFSDAGYKPQVKGTWQEAYSIVQHEDEFQPSNSLAPAR